jgi:hypothetical protein
MFDNVKYFFYDCTSKPRMNRLKYKLKKLLVLRRTASLRKNPATLTEKFVLEICKTMMRNHDTYLFVSPLSGDRLITNEDKHIDIYIKEDTIEIVNHNYHYILNIRWPVMILITKYHDRVIERRKRKMEINRGRNINHSLGKILDYIKE